METDAFLTVHLCENPSILESSKSPTQSYFINHTQLTTKGNYFNETFSGESNYIKARKTPTNFFARVFLENLSNIWNKIIFLVLLFQFAVFTKICPTSL